MSITTNSIITSVSELFIYGKYKNLSISDVLVINPLYIVWCMINIDDFILTNDAIAEIRLLYPNFIISEEFEQARVKKINNLKHK